MKILLMIFMITCMLSACGGGGGGAAPAPAPALTTPTISSLTQSALTAAQNSGGGAVTVTFTVNFIDTGGDVSTLTIQAFDATTGVLATTSTNPVAGVTGVTTGSINGILNVSTTTIGTYNVKLFITDSAGTQSNILNTTWAII